MHFPAKQRLYASVAGIAMVCGVSYVGLQTLRPVAPLSVAPISGTTPKVTAPSTPEGPRTEASTPTPIQTPEPKEVVVAMAGAVKVPGLLHMAPDARVGDAIKRAGGAKPDADLDEINLAAKLTDGDQIYVPHKKSDKPKERMTEPERSDRATRVARVSPKYRGGEMLPRYAPLTPVMPPPLTGQPAIGDNLPSADKFPASLPPPPQSEPQSGTELSAPSSLTPIAVPSLGGSTSRATHGLGHAGTKAKPASLVSLNTASEADLETLPGVGPATAQKIVAYRQEHGGFRSIDEITAIRGIGPKKLEEMRPYLRL